MNIGVKGSKGENMVARFLSGKGFTVVARNGKIVCTLFTCIFNTPTQRKLASPVIIGKFFFKGRILNCIKEVFTIKNIRFKVYNTINIFCNFKFLNMQIGLTVRCTDNRIGNNCVGRVVGIYVGICSPLDNTMKTVVGFTVTLRC